MNSAKSVCPFKMRASKSKEHCSYTETDFTLYWLPDHLAQRWRTYGTRAGGGTQSPLCEHMRRSPLPTHHNPMIRWLARQAALLKPACAGGSKMPPGLLAILHRGALRQQNGTFTFQLQPRGQQTGYLRSSTRCAHCPSNSVLGRLLSRL